MIEGFIDQTNKLNDVEKKWCNWVFRLFYGNQDIWINCEQIISRIVDMHGLESLTRITGIRLRKVMHFIRNEILPISAGKIIREPDVHDVPPSYFEANFWIVGSKKGYMATTDINKIIFHEKSLRSRILAMEVDLESSNLAKLAIKIANSRRTA